MDMELVRIATRPRTARRRAWDAFWTVLWCIAWVVPCLVGDALICGWLMGVVHISWQ